ncbi:uncharacterized protein BJ212DRAFT_922311 [Suillus subaureus]|uniref:Uncharacterized protein n=1 Tax=Suillus subaureus TaxID=48587 RepID=A0A9P7EIC2_9AGAM|nr:uncharacterized protein BJ212DRAFT_922311 [Suillus subaureus]KAG1821807.1 hypothetical protein BJ212DRAFT_922311 [Suillus subaureus]
MREICGLLWRWIAVVASKQPGSLGVDVLQIGLPFIEPQSESATAEGRIFDYSSSALASYNADVAYIHQNEYTILIILVSCDSMKTEGTSILDRGFIHCISDAFICSPFEDSNFRTPTQTVTYLFPSS